VFNNCLELGGSLHSGGGALDFVHAAHPIATPLFNATFRVQIFKHSSSLKIALKHEYIDGVWQFHVIVVPSTMVRYGTPKCEKMVTKMQLV